MRLVYPQDNKSHGFRRQCFWLLLLLCVTVSVSIPEIAISQEGTRIEQAEISGEWTIEGSPYIVMQTVTIPAGDSLSIEAGVEIIFDQDYYFYVAGSVSAIGSPEDRITFRRIDNTRWYGICFLEGSSEFSILQNCDIVNPGYGIEIKSSAPTILDNRIFASAFGISCSDCSARTLISGNYIRVESNSSDGGVGIRLTGHSEADVIDNQIDVITYFLGGRAIGISVLNYSSPRILNNWVDAQSTGSSTGINVETILNLEIRNNILRVQGSSRMNGITMTQASGTEIINNNIHLLKSSSSATGISFSTSSYAKVINNIVVGNWASTGIWTANISVVIDTSSGFNDFYGHEENYSGVWRGSEYDISQDPLWVRGNAAADNFNDYSLRWDGPFFKSPCINGGDPDIIDAHDGTRSDIGAVPYIFPNQEKSSPFNPGIVPDAFNLSAAYPNPFNSSVTIHFTVPSYQKTNVSVYNLNGQFVSELWNGSLASGLHQINWKPENIAAGLYIVKLQSESDIRTGSMLYLP